MAKKIVLALLVIVAGFLTFVVTRPDTFHVERSATIAAPANVVYAHVVDFHAWPEWSPWEKLDPAMQRTYGGAAAGPGATYSWTGNDKVGEGKMTIVDATPPSKVGIQLDFIKPFAASNTATFAMAPEGEQTKVTWSMDGKNSFMSKTMSVFMSMDKMVGGDFEKGLASMKSVVEGKPKE